MASKILPSTKTDLSTLLCHSSASPSPFLPPSKRFDSTPLFLGETDPETSFSPQYYDKEWSSWDYFQLKGNMTLKELIDRMQTDHKLEVTMITSGVSMLYREGMPSKKLEERLDMP